MITFSLFLSEKKLGGTSHTHNIMRSLIYGHAPENTAMRRESGYTPKRVKNGITSKVHTCIPHVTYTVGKRKVEERRKPQLILSERQAYINTGTN